LKANLIAIAGIILMAHFAAGQNTPPTTTRPAPPTGAGPGANGIQVSIMSAKLEYLMLKKHNVDNTTEDMVSNQNLLVIRVQILNKGKKEVTYTSFNGTPGKNDGASLLDSNKKFAALANFGDLEVVGVTKTATLKPGESVNDVLAFAPPAEGVKPVLLYLPAKNHGDAGMWKLAVKMDEAEAK
jgi:hypothetical protein